MDCITGGVTSTQQPCEGWTVWNVCGTQAVVNSTRGAAAPLCRSWVGCCTVQQPHTMEHTTLSPQHPCISPNYPPQQTSNPSEPPSPPGVCPRGLPRRLSGGSPLLSGP
jgi:hypothetical protein